MQDTNSRRIVQDVVTTGDFIIRNYTKSDEDLEQIWQMWQTIFPKWPIERERLRKILHFLPDHHYIHDKGFCLSFLTDGSQGKIAAVGVLPEYRGKGLGTAFIEKAQTELRNTARTDRRGELKSLGIGSQTPRFWPQMPIDFPLEVKEFFRHRGNFHDFVYPSLLELASEVLMIYRFSQIHRTSSPRPLQGH